MKTLLIFSFILILLSCKEQKVQDNINIQIIESYNLIDLWSSFEEANKIIRKHELDSLAKINSGVSLLDKLNKSNADGLVNQPTIDDYPIFKDFSVSLKLNNKRESNLDTSAIIGYANDTNVFLNLINKEYLTSFPKDIKWRFYKLSKEMGNAYKTIAIKQNSKIINLTNSDIDSIIVQPSLFRQMGKAVKELSSKQGMEDNELAWMKLNSKLNLDNGTYVIMIKVNSSIYVGSITSFKNNPNKYIDLGFVKSLDIDSFEKIFSNRFKYKNNGA